MNARACAYVALLALIVLVALMAAPGYAQEVKLVTIVIDIRDSSARQETTFVFDAPVEGEFNYTISERPRGLFASDGTQAVGVRVEEAQGSFTLRLTIPRLTDTINIRYTVDNVVFTADSIRHFFTELSFPTKELSVRILLPEGFGLESARPDGAIVGSDGRRVILSWGMPDAAGTLFSVKFSPLSGANGALLVLPIIAAGVAVFLFFYYRSRNREAFIAGFRSDEQKVISYLEQQRVALQSDLQKQFGFSRAKATRIVALLEAKGLLRKQRKGRTNKLFWIKK